MIDSFGALLMPIRDDPNGPAVTRNPMTYFHRVIASTSTCKGSGAYFRCGFWEHDVENFGKNCTNNQPHFHVRRRFTVGWNGREFPCGHPQFVQFVPRMSILFSGDSNLPNRTQALLEWNADDRCRQWMLVSPRLAGKFIETRGVTVTTICYSSFLESVLRVIPTTFLGCGRHAIHSATLRTFATGQGSPIVASPATRDASTCLSQRWMWCLVRIQSACVVMW